MLAHSFLFYFFSLITVFSASLVIISRNTVYSVFFLILVFVSISILFIMIGAEFLGMIMLIVYVGAVAVLFLFVVMMLNVTVTKIKKEFSKYWSVGALVSLVIFLELLIIIGGSQYQNNAILISTIITSQDISNTESLGNVLYTDYIYLFQIAGMILLVSMIGAIVLTYRKREGVKRQNYFTQISREKKTSIELVEVESDKGVKIDD